MLRCWGTWACEVVVVSFAGGILGNCFGVACFGLCGSIVSLVYFEFEFCW